jgi:hypothetical protein
MGDPILCPEEPNQLSAVVDKIMGGANEQMHELADEAIGKVCTRIASRQPFQRTMCKPPSDLISD